MPPLNQEALHQQHQLHSLLANFSDFAAGPSDITRSAIDAFNSISPMFNDYGGELSLAFTSTCLNSPCGIFEYLYAQGQYLLGACRRLMLSVIVLR